MSNERGRGRWLGRLVRDELVKKVFWWVLIGLAGLALLGYGAFRERLDWVAVAGYALAATVAIAWAAVTIHGRRSYARPHYPRLKFPYEVVKKTIAYEIGPDGDLHFSRRIRLRALVDNVDSYLDKFVWTGGECELPHAGDGAASISELYQAGIWTFFSCQLNRSLRRGEEHEFEVRWAPLTNWKGSSPFVSTSTEEPCRELEFIIRIPEVELHNQDVFIEELRGIEAAHPFTTSPRSFSRGEFTWNLRPKLYRHYRVRWSWAGGGEVPAIPAADTGEGGE